MTRRARPYQMVPARELAPRDVLASGDTVTTISVSGNDGTTIVQLASGGPQGQLSYRLRFSGRQRLPVRR